MFNPALFAASHKSPKQEAEQARQKMADDFLTTLDKMSAAERKRFWAQHDRDTAADNETQPEPSPRLRPPAGYTSGV
jgi:hypothetical protein